MWSYKRPVFSLLTLAAIIVLSACGFRPLYGRHSADESGAYVERRLADIRIDPISDRIGQELHNRLRDALNPHGQPSNPLYHLEVRLTETRRPLLLLPDLSSRREDLELFATYSLRNVEGENLFRETARISVSYNIFLDPYNDLSTRRDAHDRAVKLIAQQIRNRLAIYLNRGS